jgi:hypothetical protein
MLSATAAAETVTKTRTRKAEASEPRMEEARVTKAEASEPRMEEARVTKAEASEPRMEEARGDQSRSVGSLDGNSRRGTGSSSIRQIRRKLREAIPSPMGYPDPSPLDNTGHTRGNTLENNQDSLASERGWLPISCRQQ